MRRNGFTLIELLVAMMIFAILGVLAYGGYNTSAKQASIARESMLRLQALQTTVRLLTQDFEQLAPRSVRDVLGDNRLAALKGDPGDETRIVTLTRAGWSNPAGVQRSTLQRVAYVLEEGTLWREHRPVLDATLTDKPIRRELLKNVTAVKLRYMYPRKQWLEQWPPPTLVMPDADNSRPLAVEVTLDLKDFGKIIRIIEIGG
jgi:general secretion pathway protein J